MPGSKLCGILIFVGEANKITECGSAGIGRQARLRILWVYARVGSSPISRMMQKWRNWQTRTVQVRVVVIPCGFDSHLLQAESRNFHDGDSFFCLSHFPRQTGPAADSPAPPVPPDRRLQVSPPPPIPHPVQEHTGMWFCAQSM